MKLLILPLGLVSVGLALTLSFAYAENNGREPASNNRRGGGGAPRMSAPKFNPPKYNRPAPSRPAPSHASQSSGHAGSAERPQQAARPMVPAHHDSIGNHVTDDHMNRVNYASTHLENVMRNNPHVTDMVRVGRTHYANGFRPVFEQKRVVFNDMIAHYNHFILTSPLIIDVWHRHHFWGGFYYGFHPILDIDTYFYNPCVYWFYVGTYDDGYYRTWYQDSYDANPALHQPFQYHGVYYPTENLRQLLFGVSAMPPEKQAAFHAAVTDFTQRLAQNMANGLGSRVVLTKGDLVVTHYEILGYDDAVVLEGMVSYNGQAYNFRGLLDMEHPEQSQVFVPATWDKNPTAAQLAELDSLNARIDAFKGTPPDASVPPEPAEIPPAPPAGQAVAEPQKM